MEDMADAEDCLPKPSHDAGDGLSSPDRNHAKHSSPAMATTPAQPTFRRAPRFKQSERDSDVATRRDPLPNAFSPQGRRGRRGNAVKYAPGGLAAEVRDWLVEIETEGSSNGGNRSAAAGQGVDDGQEWMAKVIVEEVREAPGMVLVRGRRDFTGALDVATEETGSSTRSSSTSTIKVVLAGAGRLLGFARRNEVVPGAVVGIATPTWDIELVDLGVWTVVCDWVVLR